MGVNEHLRSPANVAATGIVSILCRDEMFSHFFFVFVAHTHKEEGGTLKLILCVKLAHTTVDLAPRGHERCVP